MTLDTFESKSLDTVSFDLGERMSALKRGFESSLEPKGGSYLKLPSDAQGNIARWLGMDAAEAVVEQTAFGATAMDSVREMYSGVKLEDGSATLGLKEINGYKKNPGYYDQNINQQAGYSAEVISTTKENLAAQRDGTGMKTYRADDRPDLFKKNDQYVDKIRVNDAGEIVERVQVKFVGNDAGECLSKLASKKYDKYFNDGQVDKMEVPKDYYDGIKELIPKRIETLEKQLEHVRESGDVEAAQKLEARIDRMNKIDKMVEPSTVTKDEARYATEHPRRYVAKLFANDSFAEMRRAGMESAAVAASLTAAVSTVDNVTKVIDGEITAQEAFIDVAKDTGTAGGLAYGTAFISTAISQTMTSSSHELIRSLGNAGVPAAVISFGIQSYDSVVDYANGTIGADELAYDLGESAIRVGGGMAGSALAGAALGSVVPGAGTAVGFGVGLVGGMVGCAVASEAYASAVEFGVENADTLAEKAQEMANHTVEIATEVVPNQVNEIASSLNEFAEANNLPFRV